MPEYVVTVPMKYTYSIVVTADSPSAAVVHAYDAMPSDVASQNLYLEYAGDYEISRTDGQPVEDDDDEEGG